MEQEEIQELNDRIEQLENKVIDLMNIIYDYCELQEDGSAQILKLQLSM
jgi:hypothetical protein